MNKIKKAAVGLAMALATAGGVGLVATSAEAAPKPPDQSASAVGGRSCTIGSDRWGLWHGIGTYNGYREYYGPGRFFRSDARRDCAAYLG